MGSFNVRVYGVLLEKGCILVSDECIKGDFYTKLPGGGLEQGEGTRDCLVREFKEETGLDIRVGAHLYTTDFFQQSAFDPADQLISIYYFVHCADLDCLQVHAEPFDFAPGMVQGTAPKTTTATAMEAFRWVPLSALTTETMSLPVDQILVRLLLAAHPGFTLNKTASVPPLSKKYYLQTHPFVVPVPDGKLIEEHFGLAATGTQGMSIAHMVAPPGWSEPHQWPEFDEWTIVISGKKSIEIDAETVVVAAGQSIWISRGARIRYSNPFSEPCDYLSVCQPAFSLDLVHREQAG